MKRLLAGVMVAFLLSFTGCDAMGVAVQVEPMEKKQYVVINDMQSGETIKIVKDKKEVADINEMLLNRVGWEDTEHTPAYSTAKL